MKTLKEFLLEMNGLQDTPKTGSAQTFTHPLAQPKLLKVHKPINIKPHPPAVNHAAEEAQKNREATERKHEADKNRRDAEQRAHLAQAHKQANKE